WVKGRAKRFLPVLLLLLFLPSILLAGESLDVLTQDIESFTHNPDSRFAPATMTRAQAVLGAALVADRKHDTKARQESLQAARAILTSAREQALSFRSKYGEALRLEQAATEVTGAMPYAGLDAAEKYLHALIQAFERGDLNQSVKLAADAKNAFKSVLDAKLPSLLDKTDAALLGASRTGAKRYAPQTYKAAQKWLANALAYKDGQSSRWPRHPALGIKLANTARELTLQIKQWRKHPDSYEQLVMQARRERLQVAQALGLNVDANDAAADVDIHILLQRINGMKSALAQERQSYKNDIAALKQLHALEMNEKIAALQNEMARNQSRQVGDLKEAFRAKLERETFETRRQQQLHKLFKKDEVEILANLDGSLLIHLSALKFAPGKTTIARKYFDLLHRLKAGLEQYPDRKIIIEGHTDNQGDARANQKLSLKRAEVVRDFLTAAGMSGGRLKALGYGEVRPIASNDYDRGRAMNRRIDIVIQAPL
ncbi:MAG: OmpA family protein, partial [Mariprofundaceae bacterium]|nr:OmpA family protein [Mariprofundaceae bacterium]